jgi:hypothetical protein
MRRLLALGAVGAATLVPAATAAASGNRDFAVGAGTNQFFLGTVGDAHFAFSAHSDPIGLSPQGHVVAKGDPDGVGPLPPFTAQGEVTCLRVVGNRASFKWRFERATGTAEPFAGGGVQSFVEDNGPPRDGQPVDRAALDPPQPAGLFQLDERVCDDPARANYDENETGNVVVRDASG